MDTLPLIALLFGLCFMLLAAIGIGADPPTAPTPAVLPLSPALTAEDEPHRPAPAPLRFQPQWLGIACLLASIAIQIAAGPHIGR